MVPNMFEHAVILGLAAFAVKHFFCDFPMQSVRMVMEKGHYGRRGGIEHAGIHAIGTAIVLTLLGVHAVTTLCLAIVDGLVHYHIDWGKSKIIARYQYTYNDSAFWTWLGFDQLLHYLTYLAILTVIT